MKAPPLGSDAPRQPLATTPMTGDQPGSAPFQLPPLSYGYSDLEPVIDTETMKLHHDHHHRAYVKGVNEALEKYPEWHGLSIEAVLARAAELPADIRKTVHNMGGGHANHDFFWRVLAANSGALQGELQKALTREFGSFDEFRTRFEAAGTKHFGSGWAMLVADPQADGKLQIISLPNQDTPIDLGKYALLSCDLWEHAYYLKYHDRRAEWLKSWWEIVNWDYVAERFANLPRKKTH